MIKNIIKDKIYVNEIELPQTPLKAINSYIIKSRGDVAVIDTGFNRPICIEQFDRGIKELNIDYKDIDLYSTHLHADHCGQFPRLHDMVKSTAIGRKDVEIMREFHNSVHLAVEDFNRKIRILDLKKYDLAFNDHPSFYGIIDPGKVDRLLDEGDIVKVGEFEFKVIDTPGHTPGHICLYDENNSIIIVGDHVLERITSNIAFWGFQYGDILGTYMNSLKKVRDLKADYILSSHRAMPVSLSKRVDELLEHHKHRLDEIVEIMKKVNKPMSVTDVAASMTWSIRVAGWEEFPKPQKWFATLEAMSHLVHLKYKGILDYKFDDEKILFEIAN